ncbi:MAG: hypothetical protein ACREGF_00875 [Candidatus Saccharimonadales bacterium]
MKFGQELRQQSPAIRKETVEKRRRVAVIGLAALIGAGMGFGLKSGLDASAASQKPNAVAKVTFGNEGTNSEAAIKILQAESSSKGSKGDYRPIADKLQATEAAEYPDLPNGVVQPGEQVNYYFHTSQSQLRSDIKNNYSNNSIGQSVQIEVQPSPENQTQNR